jgi:hypothetical protein
MHRLLPLTLLAPALMTAQTLDPAALQQDFKILRGALEEGHPGIYRYTPKPELDRIFDKTAENLNRPMTSLEFYRVLAPAVAALKCGHTSLMIAQDTEKSIGDSIPLIPIEARILGGKLYLESTDM